MPEEAAVRVGRTFLSAHVIGVLLAWIQIDEPPGKRSVRANGLVKGFRCTSIRVDGRFFDSAQNDMLCNNHWRNLSVRCRHKLSS